MSYLKGKATQGLILKLYQEKVIECYVDTGFVGSWNQAEGPYPGSVLFIAGYLITYAYCQILWEIQIQT